MFTIGSLANDHAKSSTLATCLPCYKGAKKGYAKMNELAMDIQKGLQVVQGQGLKPITIYVSKDGYSVLENEANESFASLRQMQVKGLADAGIFDVSGFMPDPRPVNDTIAFLWGFPIVVDMTQSELWRIETAE